jgi:hypothetical protein
MTRWPFAVANQAPPPPSRFTQSATHNAVPAAAAQPVAPLRISDVRLASHIHRVEPVYPPLPIAARIQAKVRLLGVLGTDARIRELQVLSGRPMW